MYFIMLLNLNIMLHSLIYYSIYFPYFFTKISRVKTCLSQFPLKQFPFLTTKSPPSSGARLAESSSPLIMVITQHPTKANNLRLAVAAFINPVEFSEFWGSLEGVILADLIMTWLPWKIPPPPTSLHQEDHLSVEA